MRKELVYDWLRGRGGDIERIDRQEEETNQASIRVEAIAEIAKKKLAGTSLTTEKPTDKTDIGKFKSFLVSAMPYSHKNLFPDYPGHLLATSIGMKMLAQKTGIMDPYEAELRGLTHDISSLISPNHYLRKNILTKPFTKRLGLNEKFWKEDDVVPRILQVRNPHINSVRDMSLEDALEDMMDNLCKTTSDGTIKSWVSSFAGMKDPDRKTIYGKDTLWPSTIRGIHQLYDPDKMISSRAVAILNEEVGFFSDRFNINFDQLRQEIQDEIKKPENQNFFYEAINSQETLDPEVDKKLGRKPVEMVIFDIGSVFLDGDDNALLKLISESAGVDQKNLEKAFAELLQEGMRGENPDFYRSFSEIVGGRVTKEIFEVDGLFKPIDGMKKILDNLNKLNIPYIFWSNAFASRAKHIRESMREFYGINAKQIIISSEHNLSKYDAGAFPKISRILNKNIESLVLVDDSERYVANARIAGMRGLTFRGNPVKGVSPAKRIGRELETIANP